MVALEIRMSTFGLRNALGQYQAGKNGAIAAMVEENTRLAKTLQQHVVDIVATINHRPSTGRLRKAMESPENIFVSPTGQTWGVGVASFLNGRGSPALYWRTIDEGSLATFSRGGFAGTLIYPLVFPKNPAQSHYLAWASGVTEDNKAAGSWGSSRGKIAAVTAAVGQGFQTAVGTDGKLKYPGYRPIVVKREIQPHHYFDIAFQEMLPEIRANRALKVLLDRSWKSPGR